MKIRRTSQLLIASIVLAGCTPAEAAPFGKALFGFMVVALVVIPIFFFVAWRRRSRS